MSVSTAAEAPYSAPAFIDFKPEWSGKGATQARLDALRELSVVIVDDFVNSEWIPILREAGRRVTEACRPENAYDILDVSKGYVHRTEQDEPWAIRGIVHPAFNEPSFAQFHGSDEMLNFLSGWCDGLQPEDLTLGTLLLWCNNAKHEHALGWHRDTTWWGSGESRNSQEGRPDGPEAYSEEAERAVWEKIQERNNKQVDERNSVGLFLALVDDECHEIIPGSHSRWRTPFEHDVLLPQRMKEAGVPHTPSWDGESPLPGQTAVRLKAGQALIRIGTNIHTGHTVPERERNTLVMGWSKWGGPSEDEPKTCDARTAWQLDPAVREAMPHEWMKTAWDRWAATTKLGDTLEDRYAAWDIKHIKAGNVLGWRSSLEREAAAQAQS
ncbi:MAG: hypothetical protein VXW00_13030 [Candidatus Latescibacterota bacterium]|nr:hypothetical protein [Candidatus Latescibacterota bacterium]